MTKSQFQSEYPSLNSSYYMSLVNTAIPDAWLHTLNERTTNPHREVWQHHPNKNKIYRTHTVTKRENKTTTKTRRIETYQKRDITNELELIENTDLRTLTVTQQREMHSSAECTVRPTKQPDEKRIEKLKSPKAEGTTAKIAAAEAARYPFALIHMSNSPRILNPDKLIMYYHDTLIKREPIQLSKITTKTSYALRNSKHWTIPRTFDETDKTATTLTW